MAQRINTAVMEVGMPNVQADFQIDSLARRASARFAWHWETVKIAGKVRELAVASDPNGMLIDACQRQDAGEVDVVDPFWATTWRTAFGLDRYLDSLDLSGMRVLELGCGTGHAGLAAAHRGGNVVLTDGVSDPLLLVRMSTWSLRERCQVRRLRFAIDRLDGPKFPLILGSDVTYLRDLAGVGAVSGRSSRRGRPSAAQRPQSNHRDRVPRMDPGTWMGLPRTSSRTRRRSRSSDPGDAVAFGILAVASEQRTRNYAVGDSALII